MVDQAAELAEKELNEIVQAVPEEEKKSRQSQEDVNEEKDVKNEQKDAMEESKEHIQKAEDAAAVVVPNPYVNMVPQKKPELDTSRQVYVARIVQDSIEEQNIRDGLERLFEMGFTNYDVNLTLMRRYKDFGAAAEHLCVHGEVIKE